ncbi:hypothetical protein BVRB_7g158390 [Beta vulgaris subsp. vulgaris]|nr:hypothetical protein BVRB_7g158390 [Beta vulgaris subsp. vulgaris]
MNTTFVSSPCNDAMQSHQKVPEELLLYVSCAGSKHLCLSS